MTLEELIRIIVEAVERMIKLSKIKVAAYAFDHANASETLDAAEVVNGSAQLLAPSYDSYQKHDHADILFLDYIPIEYLPRLALCILDDSISQLISTMISEGKTVYVLKKAPEKSGNPPAAFNALLDTYYSILKSYGVIFLHLESISESPVSEIPVSGPCSFVGNVLSLKELQNYPIDSSITIGQSCVITTLALETAEKMNITIIRQP